VSEALGEDDSARAHARPERTQGAEVPTCSLPDSSWPGQAVSQVAGGSLSMCLPAGFCVAL